MQEQFSNYITDTSTTEIRNVNTNDTSKTTNLQ